MEFTRTWTGNWENAFHGLRHPLESYNRSDSEFGIIEFYGDETFDMENRWLERTETFNMEDRWLEKINPECHQEYHSSEWKDYTEKEYIEQCEIIGVWLWKNSIIQKDNDTDCSEYVFLGPKDMDLAQRMIKAGTPNDKFLRQIFTSVDITAPLYWWKEMDTYKVGTTANSTSTMHKLASTPITLDCFETDDLNEWMELNNQPLNYGFEQIINYCEDLRQKYLETKDVRYWKELIRWLPESWLQTRTWTANYSILRNIYHWRKDHKLSEWHQFCDWIKTLPYAKELIVFNN